MPVSTPGSWRPERMRGGPCRRRAGGRRGAAGVFWRPGSEEGAPHNGDLARTPRPAPASPATLSRDIRPHTAPAPHSALLTQPTCRIFINIYNCCYQLNLAGTMFTTQLWQETHPEYNHCTKVLRLVCTCVCTSVYQCVRCAAGCNKCLHVRVAGCTCASVRQWRGLPPCSALPPATA